MSRHDMTQMASITCAGCTFSYDETAGLKQLYRRRDVNPLTVLERMYAGSHALAGGGKHG